jgi:hypothetical protein
LSMPKHVKPAALSSAGSLTVRRRSSGSNSMPGRRRDSQLVIDGLDANLP